MRYLRHFLSLTMGEQVFTLVWAWETKDERNTDWLTHLETAIERASAIEF